MWVPILRSFPGNEAHPNFFSGGPKWGVLGGGHKVYVEKVYVLYLSLILMTWDDRLLFQIQHKANLCVGCMPRGSCNNTLLCLGFLEGSLSKCFLEGFLEGACNGFSEDKVLSRGFLERSVS